tara:strand:- start:3841 stop:4221 length:381 start_codon:yes stop_codon:yes gene_type:complete
MKRKPQAFPTGEDLEKVKSGQREMTDTEIETNAAFMETILLRCVSPITWGDSRRRVVEDGDLDQVADDEITIGELPQADAIMIVSEASELSSLGKEAGRKAQNFPEGHKLPSEPSPTSEDVREIAI